MSAERRQLEAGIAALEAQRAALGDAVVDAAVAGLHARLAELHTRERIEGAQVLRQVAILFLDVVGSTQLSQHLDPEAISEVMDGALARATAIVEAHRGRVLQYAGDNLLAAFGTEQAAEDDTERAVYCGLALLELGRALGAEVLAAHGRAGFDVRIGIHTGPVLLGGGVDEEGTIRGIAVNIAARMEQTAPAGHLRISHDSYVLVRGLFEVIPQAPMPIKGVDAPIASCFVSKAKPRRFRIVARGIEGVFTRLVGRDGELETLQAAFKRLFSERRMRTVSVVGDAGLGKSRLLAEFQTWIEDRPETVLLFRGRATPHTERQAFGLLRDVVAWRFDLGDDDTLAQAKSKLEQGLLPLFSDEPGSTDEQAHAHLLGHLIGLDWSESPHLRGILQDARQIRNRAQHAAAQVFRRLTRNSDAPAVLLLEDLHWADDESLDFLEYLGEVDRDVPLLLVASMRPTLFERRGDRLLAGGGAIVGDGSASRVTLEPLDRTACRLMVDELLQRLPEVPTALRELLTGASAGNPFYIEELVRMLIDRGVIDASGPAWQLRGDQLSATQVPPTLTGVLQARLDGLPAAEHLALQDASVIGQVFAERTLLALDGRHAAALPSLVQRGLLHAAPVGDRDGLREYAFQHALLHQVTYDTVLKRRRRQLHRLVGDWLAQQSALGDARAGAILAATAHHYAQAGAEAEATEYHARAAEYAADRFAHGAALMHIEQGLSLLDRCSRWASPPAVREENLLRWRLLRRRERTLELQGELERRSADLDAMARVADTLDDEALRGQVAYRRAAWATHQADGPACEQFARRSVAHAEAALAKGSNTTNIAADALHELRLTGWRLVGDALLRQGRTDEAEPLLMRTLDEARQRDLPRPQSLCLNTLAGLASARNDLVLQLEYNRQALALSQRAGDRRSESMDLSNVGGGWLHLGDWQAARRDLEAALRLARQNGDRPTEMVPLCNLAVLALYEEDDARALSLARATLELATAARARDWIVNANVYMGHAEAALGRHAAAAEAYAHATELALEIGSGMRHDAVAGLARLAWAQGDLAGARREVQGLIEGAGEAAARLPEFYGADLPGWIQLTIHEVLAAAGDPAADAWLTHAHAILLARAGRIGDAALRRSYLTRIPHHRRIVALHEARGAGP